MSRLQHRFPTRNYSYHGISTKMTEPLQLAEETEGQLEAGKIHRLVVGIDVPPPKPMFSSEVEVLLRDPFAELLLKRSTFPLTLRTLLTAFGSFDNTPQGLPQQVSYLVADGGHIPWTAETDSLNRQFRFAITRGRGAQIDVLISTSTVIDSETNFLQLLAWDSQNQVYNYYQRRSGTWIWAGNSQYALEPATRGKGPFDSHVNGSLVMKELKLPWTHWHSMSAGIKDESLAPDDPLRSEPLFRNKAGAELLQLGAVQPGIIRWNNARLGKSIAADGTISDVPYLMRQVLETTTVNLASSETESRLVQEDTSVRLPLTFFLNSDALLNEIHLAPNISRISVEGRLYLDSLKRYEFAVKDGNFHQEGDAPFAFLVPEPAFEDLNVLSQLLQKKIITRHFAASLLMVDFPNPIFSSRRQQLLKYVPDEARLASGSSDLPSRMVSAIEAVEQSLPVDSPEKEFLANWRLPDADWKTIFERRIEDYFAVLTAKAATEEGFDGFVRLAESRRREFRKRPIHEFDLNLPTTNIPMDSPWLEMSEDGTVRSKVRS
jgi:hypothetical protein